MFACSKTTGMLRTCVWLQWCSCASRSGSGRGSESEARSCSPPRRPTTRPSCSTCTTNCRPWRRSETFAWFVTFLFKFDVPCSYSRPHAVEREQNICMVHHLLLEFGVPWIFTLGSINTCAQIKKSLTLAAMPLLGHNRNTAHAGKNGWCCSCCCCAVPRYGAVSYTHLTLPTSSYV